MSVGRGGTAMRECHHDVHAAALPLRGTRNTSNFTDNEITQGLVDLQRPHQHVLTSGRLVSAPSASLLTHRVPLWHLYATFRLQHE